MDKIFKIIPFSSVQNWSVFDAFLSDVDSSFPLKKLGDYITLSMESTNIVDNTLYKQVRVKTKGGGAVKRKELLGKDIGTKKQYYTRKGQLIVSKIDARNGAFAIIPEGLDGAVVTGSFLLYDVHDIEIEYLVMVMSSPLMKKQWQAISSGTTNRQSVNNEKVKNFMIPVPSIAEQQEILKSYHSTLAKADDNIEKGNRFSDGLLLDIQSEVSDLKKQEKNNSLGTSIIEKVPFSSVSRWEVAYILRESRLKNVYNSFKCPVYSISQLQKESFFGLSIKASTTQKKGMIPMIRMSNIVNGEIDCSGMKYLPYKCAVTDKEPDKWLLRKGDFLINRTNSKELVGKSAVFNLEGDFTYASYVIRYRFDTSIVLPEYINILFMLPIVRIQIDTVSRQTAGQCNINSDEIGAIRIPVPSIPEQQAIIDKYYSTKDGSNTYYENAFKLREKAASDFEKQVFC